ncbi:MAG: hypothetical protein HYV35_00195 [Lentisphaerae bacterium]|nr:hypothetical protein [Lentisphaerota bacterium]
MPDPANTPGAREAAVSWMDGSGALWLFGGYGYPASGGDNELNDLWKYDPATTNWTWMKGSTNTSQNGTYGTQGMPAAGNTPGARYGAVSWTDGSGALWLFGGIGYPASGSWGYLNDLWKYDPATTNWTWEAGASSTNQNGTYGTQGVPATTNTPGARYREVAWTDGSGALWLFGGYGRPASGGLGFLNDLWKYDNFGGGISLATNALVFSATYQGANPPAQMIGMTNVGGKGFTYTNVITYSTGASGWLTVLPAAGTVALNGATVLTNQVNIAGLNAGTYYATNQVTADATNSPQTVVVTLSVNAPNQPPSAPTGVSAGDGTYTNKVRVTWNASSGATSYEVWRWTSDSSYAASKISSPDPTGTSYDDMSVTAGATYYYWVKAVNAAGASGFSASDSGFLGVVGPLITANGLVGEVDINSGDPVTIAVQMMNIESFISVEVDWWVVASANLSDWYYLNGALQWQEALFSGDFAVFHPVYQGLLVNLASTPVLNGFILPPGTYDFWFAVDYPLDGILNLNGPILYDQVTVFVQ